MSSFWQTLKNFFSRLFAKKEAPIPQPAVQPVESEKPAPAPISMVPRSREGCVARYGNISNLKWADESKWMTYVDVDPEVGSHWFIDGNSAQPVRHIRCNKDMKGPLTQAIKNLKDRGLVHELKSFDGCFNIRNTRGSSSISAHAWGLALDLNYHDNQLGTAGKLTPEFVKCWTDCGFTWGGNFHGRKDPMHFSLPGF